MEAILQAVRMIIAEETKTDIDKIKATSPINEENLGADSLTIVEMVMEIEEKFEIEIPEDDIRDFVIVSDLVAYIEERVPDWEDAAA